MPQKISKIVLKPLGFLVFPAVALVIVAILLVVVANMPALSFWPVATAIASFVLFSLSGTKVTYSQ